MKLRQSEVVCAQESDKRRGRIEYRKLEATGSLNDYLAWPGLKQVCRIERRRTLHGQTSTEVVAAITSLSREQASAERLLEISRAHWGVENRLHWVRDMTLGEDACRVRSGSAPQILAGLRNAVLRLIRRNGRCNVAATLRRCAAKPLEALRSVRPQLPGDF